MFGIVSGSRVWWRLFVFRIRRKIQGPYKLCCFSSNFRTKLPKRSIDIRVSSCFKWAYGNRLWPSIEGEKENSQEDDGADWGARKNLKCASSWVAELVKCVRSVETFAFASALTWSLFIASDNTTCLITIGHHSPWSAHWRETCLIGLSLIQSYGGCLLGSLWQSR